MNEIIKTQDHKNPSLRDHQNSRPYNLPEITEPQNHKKKNFPKILETQDHKKPSLRSQNSVPL
jgi:hypothetical protein